MIKAVKPEKEECLGIWGWAGGSRKAGRERIYQADHVGAGGVRLSSWRNYPDLYQGLSKPLATILIQLRSGKLP